MNSLAERLDNFPEAWRPETPGEKLIGELTDVDLRESDYGDAYPILTVRSDEDGNEYVWHAFHQMARNAVKKKQPQVGERVGIVYAGLGEPQPGMNAPVRWRLLVERPEQERFDYDTVPAAASEDAVEQPDADIPY